MKKLVFLSSLLFLLIALCSELEAGEILFLKNGRIMFVKETKDEGNWKILKLEGGGEVRIKKEIIERIEEGKSREATVLKKSTASMKVERAGSGKGGGRDYDLPSRYRDREEEYEEPPNYEESEADSEENDEEDGSRRSRRLRRAPTRRGSTKR